MTSEGQWRAVALSAAIEAGSATGIILEGRELVVWRDAGGVVHAWDDRCPHRGMRLSFGFVRGDRLGCLYHGWQFDGAGQCQVIPAHPELTVPKTIKIPPHAVTEALGIVWVALEAAPPAITVDPGPVTAVRSLYIDRPLGRAMESVAGKGAALDAVVGQPLLWTLANGVDRLLIAGQVVDAQRSALHIALLTSANPDCANLVRVARWAERLRASVEREGA